MNATEKDLELLKKIYDERQIYQGEAHDHAATGGTSDGKRSLEHWKGAMEAQEMDFAAILDHKQVRHMYLPEWDNTLFIGGTEAGGRINGKRGQGKGVTDYNMVFSKPEPLQALLEEFPEFGFTGGPEGHFNYRSFTRERLTKLIDAVKRHGGFFVIPHPTCSPYSDDPFDFWFADEVGIEVPYIALDSVHTPRNYEIWRALLDMGKRMWVCAGGDKHACAHDWALTSIYAEEKHSDYFVKYMRRGDFTAGPVGIQMCVGDMHMGGKCDFEGQRLVIRVGKFHKSVRNPEHKYRLDLWDDTGVIYSQEISCEEPTYIAMDTSVNSKFYRVEIYDVNRELRLALGNPIWNEKNMKICLIDNGYNKEADLMKRTIEERIPVKFGEEGLCIELCMDQTMPASNYQIEKSGERWKIAGADEMGIFYGMNKFLHTAKWSEGDFVPNPPAGVKKPTSLECFLYAYDEKSLVFPTDVYEDMSELRVDGPYWKMVKEDPELLKEYIAYEFGSNVVDDVLKLIGLIESNNEKIVNHTTPSEEDISLAETLADHLYGIVGERVKRTWRFRILRLHTKIDRIIYDIYTKVNGVDKVNIYEVRNTPKKWLSYAEDRVAGERVLELWEICKSVDK